MDIRKIFREYQERTIENQERTIEKYETKNNLGKLVYGFSNMWLFDTLGNMVKSLYKSLKRA